tara:strand:+ start:227 stop:511 length:285 start_codon:yes stop_codon:yes gene_type:complete
MSERYVEISQTDETQIPTKEEEMYFSRSKNTWLPVSDMSDVHVRRAFKRLLKMIRLGQLIELEDMNKSSFEKIDIQNEVYSIKKHLEIIEDKIK